MIFSRKGSRTETKTAPKATADAAPRPNDPPSRHPESSANGELARNGGQGMASNPPSAQPVAPPQLSSELSAEFKRRAAKSKQLQASFGEIVGLLMRTPKLEKMPLSYLEQMVVPAITTGQFMIAEAQAKKSGFVTPVAAVLWASVSEEIDRRLSDKTAEAVKLDPKDWKSGDIPWVIVAAGDQRVIKVLLQRIQETALKGRPLKFRSPKKGDETVAPTASPK